VKFSFIAKSRAAWPADWICGALGVSRGDFYAWLTNPRSRSDEELGAKVRASLRVYPRAGTSATLDVRCASVRWRLGAGTYRCSCSPDCRRCESR